LGYVDVELRQFVKEQQALATEERRLDREAKERAEESAKDIARMRIEAAKEETMRERLNKEAEERVAEEETERQRM
jgi:hypothetical protein